MNFVHFFQLPSGQSTHFQSVVHPDGQSHQFQTQTVHDVGNVIATRDEINQVGNILSCYALAHRPHPRHNLCLRISLKEFHCLLSGGREISNLVATEYLYKGDWSSCIQTVISRSFRCLRHHRHSFKHLLGLLRHESKLSSMTPQALLTPEIVIVMEHLSKYNSNNPSSNRQ